MLTPKDLGLKQDKWRPNQAETIATIRTSESSIIQLDAPTGSGKSLIALGTILSDGGHGYALTQTKSLQYQYMTEGNGLVEIVVGRANYPCALARQKMDVEERLLRESLGEMGCTCKNKKACPYQIAKVKALSAQIASLNYAYWLPESSSIQGFIGADYIFADEGHLLDGVLTNAVSIKIPSITINRMKSVGLFPPNNSSGIGQWIKYAKVGAGKCLDKLTNSSIDDVEKEMWDRRRRMFLKCFNIESNADKWVASDKDNGVLIRPTWPPPAGEVLLGKENEKGKKLIIMSATILDKEMFAWILGIQGSEYLSIPWTFSKENRPIYYRPVADVTQGSQELVAKNLASAVEGIMSERKGEKGVIHTRSFTLGELIYQHLRNKDRILYHGRTEDRSKMISNFKSSKKDVWLMSPSISHGEDFAYDTARCQIICKVPFPDLGDEVVAVRFKQRPDWYFYSAIQEVIQIIGRVNRAEDDYGESWVLDGKFGGLLDKYNKYVPNEIEEAIK